MSMPIQGTIVEAGDVLLMARVTGADGEHVTIADVDTISYTVWKAGAPPGVLLSGSTTTPTNITGATSLTPADVMFDDLQTDDPRWTVDEDGYNFRAIVPAANCPTTLLAAFNTRVWARIDVVFTMADGSKAVAQYWPELLPTLTAAKI